MLRTISLAIVVAIWTLMVSFVPHAASAQSGTCTEDALDAILQRLSDIYGEAPIFLGELNSGRQFLLLGDPDQTSWTVLATDPVSGLTCGIASGEDWMLTAPPNLPKGEEG